MFEGLREKSDALRASSFPMDCSDGITVRPVPPWEMQRFHDASFECVMAGVAGDSMSDAWRNPDGLALARNHFTENHGEWLLFFHQQEPIGWHHGIAIDHETYLMKTTGLLPQWQCRGIYSAFLEKFLDYLKELGYSRVESGHSPKNRRVLIAKLKAGFEIHGFSVTSRQGPQVLMERCLESRLDPCRADGR